MGVLPKPIYAREALLPMSVGPNAVRNIYVPFVDPTDARSTAVATLAAESMAQPWPMCRGTATKTDRDLDATTGVGR
jgi:hypothetical protein